jgi:hypothetical protein
MIHGQHNIQNIKFPIKFGARDIVGNVRYDTAY